MNVCKYCHSNSLVKKGIKDGKQVWLCTNCEKHQSDIDKRERFSPKEVHMAISVYLHCLSYRSTANVLSKIFKKKYNGETISKWIKDSGLSVNNRSVQITDFPEGTQTLDSDKIDEYIEKGILKEGYVLAYTEISTVFLRIKKTEKK